MKNFFFLLVGLGVIAGSFYAVLQKPAPEKYQTHNQRLTTNGMVQIGEASIKVELADSPEERERGLSGRESLAWGSGLLFLFEEPAHYGFWMKEMNFPIDIVWIDESLQVIGVERGVAPDTFPQTFAPPSPVKYVLELPAGYAAALNIDTGEILYLEAQN